MFLKEQDVMEYVEKIGLVPQSNSSIWGTGMPSKLSGAVYGAVSVLDLKYNVVHFTANEVVIIAISSSTGKIKEQEHLIIPRADIHILNFKKGLMSYTLQIETKAGTIQLKVNKAMVGAKWHKSNLENILQKIA